MIISASRRTDIPAFFGEWFINCIKAGFVYVRNPIFTNKVTNVSLKKDDVTAIVFWTKDATNFLPFQKELMDMEYKHYFQYTITPYKKDIEPNINDKNKIINSFIELSNRIGKEYVILRYDPIFLNEQYDINYHIRAFEKTCELLSIFTNKIIVSILDSTKFIKKNYKEMLENNEIIIELLLPQLCNIAKDYGVKIESCAEELNNIGIPHTKCIDNELISKLTNQNIKYNKDKSQRKLCNCVDSIDIGEYNTCKNGCIYCYANKRSFLCGF